MNALSRRELLRMLAAGSTGVAGAIALAACGETQVVTKEVPVQTTVVKEVPVETIVTRTQIKEVPVERIVIQTQVKEVPVETVVTKEVPVETIVEKVVEKIVTKEVVVEKLVEAPPQQQTTRLVFVHDHTSGPRGNAMKWSLDMFAAKFPHIDVKFTPQPEKFAESFGPQIAAGTQGEVALLGDGMVAAWAAAGAWALINPVLAKHPDFDPLNWYYDGDAYSLNFQDTVPIDILDGLRGPMFGMPYQGNVNGHHINLTMMEAAGIAFPTKGNWQLEGQFLEDLKKATDPDTETFGLWALPHAWLQWGSWAWGLADDPNIMYRSAADNRLTILDSGGDRGLRLIADMVAKHEVAPAWGQRDQLAGEFGDPFAAGRVLIAPNGGAVGSAIPRIKDRFAWSMAPFPEGPRGTVPHDFTGQPHIVTNAVDTRGNIEQAVEVVMFWAGPDVQGRVAVDRGSLPMFKDVLTSPAFEAGPPENHGLFRTYVEEDPNPRSQQLGHPAWLEWWEAWFAPSEILNGEQTVDEAMGKRVEQSNLVLEQSAEAYQELKDYIAGLSF